MVTVLELESAIIRREAAVGAQVCESGDQTLIHVQRGELVQLLEQVRTLGHYL